MHKIKSPISINENKISHSNLEQATSPTLVADTHSCLAQSFNCTCRVAPRYMPSIYYSLAPLHSPSAARLVQPFLRGWCQLSLYITPHPHFMQKHMPFPVRRS